MEPGLLLIRGPVPLPPSVAGGDGETRDASLRRRVGQGSFRDAGDAPLPLGSASGCPCVPDCRPGHAGLEAIAYTFSGPAIASS